MATQTIQFAFLTGQSPTVKLFADDGSDTVLETPTATEATNRTGVYTFTQTDRATGNYLITVSAAGINAEYSLPLTLPASAGTYWAVERANVTHISGDSTAADNLKAAADGTGYNLGGGSVVAASVTGAAGSVTGSVGSVIGSVGGNVTGSVASVVGAVGSVTGNLGGSVNGNVSGSVGSVTGAVGSVTGSVGSVIGNVGGSVASVAGAVGSVTGNVGGDVSGKVIGGGSGTITGDGVRASSVTGAVGSVTGSVGSLVGLVTWNPDWDTEVQSECTDAIVAAGLPRSGVTLRYTQVAANSGGKTADVSIGAAL